MLLQYMHISDITKANEQEIMGIPNGPYYTIQVRLVYYDWDFADDGYVRRAPRDGWST